MPRRLATLDVYWQRVVANCVRNPVTGCWDWGGAMSQSGWRGCFYPCGRVFGKIMRLNRFVLMVRTGPLDVLRAGESIELWLDRCRAFYAGQEAAHTCDNSYCLNPAHLAWQPHAVNVREQVQRRRARPAA